MKKNAGQSDQNIFQKDLHHGYLHFRRTKIVATIGPASSSPETIRELIRRGLNVARINFSHGEPEEHLRTIRTIRTVSGQLRIPVAVLADLCGPKIRVGRFRGQSCILKEGSFVTITVKPVLGDAELIPCQYQGIVKEVSAGHRILLDDGNLELRVVSKSQGQVRAKVIHGGLLKDHKGMNLPDTDMHVPSLTPKDRKDLGYCIRANVDYVALSFVRRPEDVKELKGLLRRRGADIAVIAKIEKPEALESIQGIIEAADGIMIARGDLGVELPAKKVPFIQAKLIETCIRFRKPVIVATQMLESMIEHARPTRAEVTDVAAACLAGADAVMLSAETASGRHPVEALLTMDSILRETEAYRFFTFNGCFRDEAPGKGDSAWNPVSTALAQLSRDLMVRCIVVATRTGLTALGVSSGRPSAPVLVLTSSTAAMQRLQLVWGVFPHRVSRDVDAAGGLVLAEAFMKKMKLAGSGDFLLMVSGSAGGKPVTHTISAYQIP